MRILAVSHYGPIPPLTGGARRIYEQYSYLSRWHDVDFVCRAPTRRAEHAIRAWAHDKLSVHVVPSRRGSGDAQILRRDGLDLQAARQGPLACLARRLAESARYDIAMAEHCFNWPTIQDLGIQRVVTEHNIESDILLQCRGLSGQLDLAFALADESGQPYDYAMRYAERVAEFERDIWAAAELTIAVTQDDAARIGTIAQRQITVPNNCYQPAPLTTRRRRRPSGTGVPTVVFVGALNYLPNIDGIIQLIHHVMPQVRKELRDAQALVIGREPSRALRDFCHRWGVAVVPNPKDAWAAVPDNAVLVVPLRIGGGGRIKIFDAFAAGVPVVSSLIGCAGLGPAVRQLVAYDGAGAIATDVIKLFTDAAYRARRVRAAAALAMDLSVSWEAAMGALDSRLRELAGNLMPP